MATRNRFRQTRHLANPLINSEIDHIVECAQKHGCKFLSASQRRAISSIDDSKIVWKNYGRTHCAAMCLYRILWQLSPDTFDSINAHLFDNEISTATECLRLSKAHSLSNTIYSICIYDYRTILLQDTTFVKLYNLRNWIRQVLRDVTNDSVSDRTLFFGNFNIRLFGNQITYACCLGDHIEMWDTITSLSDIVHGRFTTIMYAIMADAAPIRPYLLSTPIKQLLTAMDTCVERSGSDAYTVFKSFPSLAVGFYLLHHEEESGRYFLPGVLADLEPFNAQEIINLFNTWCTTINGTKLALELSGLWKTCGHPVVDMDSGVEKINERGNSIVYPDPEVVREVVNTFRFNFIRDYWNSNGVWPNHILLNDAHTLIQAASRSNSWNSQGLKPEMFDAVFFTKTFVFNSHPDLLDLLSDKSICADRYQISREMNSQAYQRKYGTRLTHVGTSRSKRLLLEILDSPQVDIDNVINTIETYNELPESDRVIVLVAKERELKIQPRFFCKSSLNARLWQVVTELNVSDQILKYIPFQTMTSDASSLLKRLCGISSYLKEDGDRFIVVPIDFSSWNLRFRHATMATLYRDFDRLFGFKRVFSYSQLFPMTSQVLVQDAFDPPRVLSSENGLPTLEPGPRAFDGFQSWFEGMRQKPWTVFTSNLIALVARTHQYHVSITCQGDNQLIAVRLKSERSDETDYQYVRRFILELEAVCDKLMIPIKPDESWASKRLLEYSKQYFLNGDHVPGVLKKLTRLHAPANEELPTTAGDIASVFAAASSCADTDHSPDLSYLIGVFESVSTVRASWTSLWTGLTPTEQVIMMLTPRVFGGIPVTPYADMLFRGSQDPLTLHLSLFKFIYKNASEYQAGIRVHKLCIDDQTNTLLLLKDPLSLPVRMSVQPENLLKRVVTDVLRATVKNIKIRAALTTVTEGAVEQLKETLLALRPLNPQIANAYFTYSNVAYVEKIIGRFSTTSSVKQLALRRPSISPEDSDMSDVDAPTTDIINMMKISDANCEMEYIRKVRTGRTAKTASIGHILSDGLIDLDEFCTYQFAAELRRRAWNLPIEYITRPTFFEQCFVTPFKLVPSEMLRKTVFFNILPGADRSNTRGGRVPYLGTRTLEKERKPLLQSVIVPDALTAIKNIIAKTDWIADPNDENFKLLRDILIREKTGYSIEFLSSLAGTIYGGRPEHRLNNPMSKPGASHCGTVNFATYLQFSSNSALDYAQSSDDFFLMFQTLYLGTEAVIHALDHGGLVPKSTDSDWGCIIRCTLCTEKLPTEPYRLIRAPVYQGLSGVTRVDTIEVIRPTIYPASAIMDPRREAAAYLGFKIVNRMRTYDRHEALAYEHYAHSTGSISNVINLTEFRLLDIEALFCTMSLNLGNLDAMSGSRMRAGINPTILHLPGPCALAITDIYANLARAIISTRRIHEIYQIYPNLPKFYNASLTVEAVCRVIALILAGYRHDYGHTAIATIRYVPATCSLAIFERYWLVALRSQLGVKEAYQKESKNLKEMMKTKTDLNQILRLIKMGSLPKLWIENAPKIMNEEGDVCRGLRAIAAENPISEIIPGRYQGGTVRFEIDPDINFPSKVYCIVPPNSKDDDPISFDTPMDRPRSAHHFRCFGSISTAPSKYLEVISSEIDSTDVLKNQSIVCFAEGAGAVANCLLHIFPRGLLYYNSLLPLDEIGMDPTLFMPPACTQDSCNAVERSVPFHLLNRAGRDLRDSEAVDTIVNTIKDTNAGLGLDAPIVLTMDAERPHSLPDYEALLRNTLKAFYSLMSEKSLAVLKVFVTEPAVFALIKSARAHFDSVSICKPITSERISAEAFVVLKHPIKREFCWLTGSSVGVNTAMRSFKVKRDKILNRSIMDLVCERQKTTVHLLKMATSIKCLASWIQDMNSFSIQVSNPKDIYTKFESRIETIKTNMIHSSYENLQKHISYEVLKLVVREGRDGVFRAVLNNLVQIRAIYELLKKSYLNFVNTVDDPEFYKSIIREHFHAGTPGRTCERVECEKPFKHCCSLTAEDLMMACTKKAKRLYWAYAFAESYYKSE